MPNSTVLRATLIAWVVCLTLLCCHAQAAQPVQPPSWLEIRPVSEAMIISGFSAGAQHLASQRPAAVVLDYYRDLWQCGAGDERCRLAVLPPWQVLSRFDGRHLEYVQVRDDGLGATGYLAVSDFAANRRPPGSDIPVMQGSRVVHELSTSDPGKQGRVLQVRNGYSVASNGSFYRTYFMDRNWQPQVAEVGDDRGVLVFHKGRAEAHVVITRQDTTTSVVINLVD
ncbi:hypothetical protein [Desulfofustis limnaeus]|jgi:hypothetical protein|uniref:Uncharacterized protein n=1 Tax=Desulfofustis limnaeus TaxID=2740163 RepID=A0ABN6MA69_9BACT|nr:hypothetical protein [Desulfofustis limnaeus]MDX9895167.1 hypothetical protein [Desulfofustis sp.]BDD88929.1 hypothetical protein DPPLL_32940 [Desulfofustis limnaeus]